MQVCISAVNGPLLRKHTGFRLCSVRSCHLQLTRPGFPSHALPIGPVPYRNSSPPILFFIPTNPTHSILHPFILSSFHPFDSSVPPTPCLLSLRSVLGGLLGDIEQRVMNALPPLVQHLLHRLHLLLLQHLRSHRAPTPTLGCSHVNTTFFSSALMRHLNSPSRAPWIRNGSIYARRAAPAPPRSPPRDTPRGSRRSAARAARWAARTPLPAPPAAPLSRPRRSASR